MQSVIETLQPKNSREKKVNRCRRLLHLKTNLLCIDPRF